MAKLTGIIDYGMGNIKSVYNALDSIGEDVALLKPEDDFGSCSHLILPGVGAYRKAMGNIISNKIDVKLKKHVQLEKPLLGICLGMQLFSSIGYEGKKTKGLDLIQGCVKKMDISLHIPHVGWNNIKTHDMHPILQGIKLDVDFYFVHSFHFQPEDIRCTIASTDYETDLAAIVTNQKSVVGVQFHPEKSQENGLKLLENFCEWNGQLTTYA